MTMSNGSPGSSGAARARQRAAVSSRDDGTPPASPAAHLAACVAAFAALGTAFDLDAERMARAEDLARVELVARVALDRLDDLLPADVGGWFVALGADLEVELRLVGLGLEGGDESAVVLRHDSAPGDAYVAFVTEARDREAAGGAALDVEARIALAKTGMVVTAREALAERPGALGTPEVLAVTAVAVFYSPVACARTLLTPAALPQWESAGLARPDGRAALVLLDAGGYLAGPALEVIGARDLGAQPWLDLDAATWEQSRRQRTRMRELRDAESIWMIPACGLTSEALAVEQQAPGLEPMARAVAALRERLAAMELAASVQASAADALVLRFAGEPVRGCTLAADEPHADAPLTDEALSRLAAFAYGSDTPDRLYIARDCLAQGFPAVSRVTLVELEDAARRALPAAAATFNLYLKRQTEHYFTARQQALDAVETYAEGVRKSVGDLTSDVVSDVYKTAGLLLAVVIAALLGPAHARLVWELGTIAYLAYLIFIVRFLLPARERRFVLDGREVLDHLRAVSELTRDEKHEIWQTAARANDYFRHYLRRSRWIYYALAAAGLIFLLVLLTPLAAHLPLVSSPAATPTSIPATTPGA